MMEKFQFNETELQGHYVINPFYVSDERGGFVKDYNIEMFKTHGIEHELKETFYTLSYRGVIRAIHFQLIKPQPKLVRCIKGKVWAAVVDLRPNSKTFSAWVHYEMSGDNRIQLLIPEGFGWGYLVLEDSVVSYKCAEVFYSDGDSGIKYDDPEIGISWPFELIGGKDSLIISEKDKNLMSFEDYKKFHRLENKDE